ncbi:MAG: hypothetical protein NW217_15505 [Hyphomicrobiaceae bacterium]|nr:hypothetical protein [Hyphomicrobiaceae bacterium]
MTSEQAMATLVGVAVLAVLVFVVWPARADRRKRERQLRIDARRGRDRWQNPSEPDVRLQVHARRNRRDSDDDRDDDGGPGSESGGGGGDGGGGGGGD